MRTVVCNCFDECEFDRLLCIALAYGTPIIYCSYQFAISMIPQEIWAKYTKNMSAQTDSIFYKGFKVIILDDKTTNPNCASIVLAEVDADPTFCCSYTNTALTSDEKHNLEVDKNIIYQVKNNSMSDICYHIFEDNIRKTLFPNEIRQIKGSELEKLNALPGGYQIITQFAINKEAQDA